MEAAATSRESMVRASHLSIATLISTIAACSEDFTSSDGSAGASGESTGGTSGVSAGGGGGSGGGTPDGCVPSEEGNPVENKCGIFVSSSIASAAPDGTKEKPYKTIAEALTAAKGKPIYVCAEATPYAEEVAITQAVDIYGALDCSKGWAYDAAKRTAVAPAAPGIPLRVTEVSGSVQVEDFDFTAADATQPGGSSIGAFVSASSDVSLLRVGVAAGNAQPGASGILDDFMYPSQLELNGVDGTAGAGALANTCDCPAGDQSTGGPGGNPPAQSGGPGLPSNGGGEAGTSGQLCNMGGGGGNGDPGVSGGVGAGATALGSVDAEGWQPASGTDGKAGGPGQGGGGGSSPNGGGGSGGCGGCGGAGGPAGKGGGGSIALVSLDSAVTIDGGMLTARDAGNGGAGVSGQSGQQIFGGFGNGGGALACPGGYGGVGADGGPGGGGAGGLSAGVVFKGPSAPQLPNTNIEKGAAGDPGAGGMPGTNDGVAGDSKDVHEITG